MPQGRKEGLGGKKDVWQKKNEYLNRITAGDTSLSKEFTKVLRMFAVASNIGKGKADGSAQSGDLQILE